LRRDIGVNFSLHRENGSMAETSVSLLQRLRTAPDAASWQRLVDLYSPLVQGWLRRHFVQLQDAEDLTQEVLGVLVRELKHFEHNQRPGAFRAWLRTITVNGRRSQWRNRQGKAEATGDSAVAKQLDQLEDPRSGLSQLWDQQHDRHVMARLLDMIACEFNATTWQAFERHVLDEEPASFVAAALGVSVNVVLLAKSRILRRLRQEGQGILD
jgi:RNA polymerase sigma-70 factor (ECF subfamily)